MRFLGGFGAAVCVGLLFLLALFLRRFLICRSGALDVSMRLYRTRHGRGWSLGFARFSGDQLLWYRMFSLAPRPRCVLSRSDLVIVHRREPSKAERVALMHGSTVLECKNGPDLVELAIPAAALTGFMSWLEAAPSGAGPTF